MKKKILFTMAIFIAVFATASVIKIKAGTGENVSGWSWGGSEEAPDTVINGNESGVGWISSNNITGGGTVNYGINIPNDGSPAWGYAWSENIGWISFQPGDLVGCPQTPCNTRRVGNDLIGWARIMSMPQAGVNSGGWTGWVKMNGTAQDGTPYGVTVDPSTGKFNGYAWSGGVSAPELGAIKMQGVNYVTMVTPPAQIISFTATPSKTDIEANPNFLSTANNVILRWDSVNAASCDISGGWTGGGLPAVNSTGQSISQTSGIQNYTLICRGPGGDSLPMTISVYTYCNDRTCGTGACNSTENVSSWGISNVANVSTTCNQLCSDNTQCEGRSSGTWKEVAP